MGGEGGLSRIHVTRPIFRAHPRVSVVSSRPLRDQPHAHGRLLLHPSRPLQVRVDAVSWVDRGGRSEMLARPTDSSPSVLIRPAPAPSLLFVSRPSCRPADG